MLSLSKAFATISTEWTIPQDLPYFNGHFPGNPVFPAVGIVDASLELIRQKSGARVYLAGVVSAKFMQPVGPNIRVHVDVKDAGSGVWDVEWTEATDRTKRIASLSLKVAEE